MSVITINYSTYDWLNSVASLFQTKQFLFIPTIKYFKKTETPRIGGQDYTGWIAKMLAGVLITVLAIVYSAESLSISKSGIKISQ